MLRLLFSGLISLLALLATACFNVREPEEPGTAGGWTSPTETRILMENLRIAVTTLNVVNYERCMLPQNFIFVPDPLTPGVANGVFNNWSLPEERIYLTNLKSNSSSSSGNLNFSNGQELFFTADSLELTSRYDLSLQHQDTSFPHYHFNGTLRMILVRRQNEWKIQSWQDNRLSDSLCWTDLKKHFYAP